MQAADGQTWTTDPDQFAAIPGGRAVVAWFGFTPSFHDAKLLGIEISDGSATLRVGAFRMTSDVDAKGYFILDRHAVVVLEMSGVSGVTLTGNAQSIIAELRIRRIDVLPAGFEKTCAGPSVGDFEVSFEASYGLEGSIYAKELSIGLTPRVPG